MSDPSPKPSARWQVNPPRPEKCQELAAALGVSEITAQLLLNRGVTDVESARVLCNGRMVDLHPPLQLTDMDRAAERIRDAVARGERLLIYGDYDADGVCATAVLLRFLQLAGATAEAHIPDRLTEGYGLNEATARAIAERQTDRVSLIITVDTGIGAFQEARIFKQAGIDLIITDHHEPDAQLPDAYAIVHPRRGTDVELGASLPGVGLAYKLAWAASVAISGSERVRPTFREFLAGDALAFAAVGIIADSVPLRGENHILAKHGLRVLRARRNPGLSRLMEVAGVGSESLTARDIAFMIAPRINAAGRTGDARRALDLLISDDPETIARLADELNQANRQRQTIERRILDDAVAKVEALREKNGELPPAIVLGSSEWHPGVIGIVASRLVDRYLRPAVLAAFDPETGLGRGSARSVNGFALHEALAACRQHLVKHGGHAAAAGFSCRQDEFTAFARAFEAVAAERLKTDEIQPVLEIDAEIQLVDLNLKLAGEFESLAPFGVGNPQPQFLSRGVTIAGRIQPLGKTNRHLAFYARQGDGVIRCVGFGFGPRLFELEELQKAGPVDLVFEPQINTWAGAKVELVLRDIRAE